MEAGSHSAMGAPGPILGAPKRRTGEKVIQILLVLAAAISVLTTVGIVLSLAGETFLFFTEGSLTRSGQPTAPVGVFDFLFGTTWAPQATPEPSLGVLPLITGTFVVSGISLVVAIPLGLAAAIYLAEYSSTRVRKLVKPVLELLAGIPTIVFGFFALVFFTPLLKDLGIELSSFNALSAGVIMGFMVLPTIASLSEDAMRAVPASLREGSFGLGASRLQTSLRVVFPAALSGIVAAIVLGVSRAVGETMIVLIAGGIEPNFSLNPTISLETMTAFIANTGKGDVPAETVQFKAIFAVGALLFLITLVMNAISIRFVRKYRQVYE